MNLKTLLGFIPWKANVTRAAEVQTGHTTLPRSDSHAVTCLHNSCFICNHF